MIITKTAQLYFLRLMKFKGSASNDDYDAMEENRSLSIFN